MDVNHPGPQEDFVSNWEPACGLVEDASLGPRLPLSGSGCPLLASLSPAGDGPDHSQLALLWYSLSPLFYEQASNVFSAVQFSRSVVSDPLQPHELQYARPPCPSPTHGVYSKLMPRDLVTPFSHLILYRPLLLLHPVPPASRSFPVSQLFT